MSMHDIVVSAAGGLAGTLFAFALLYALHMVRRHRLLCKLGLHQWHGPVITADGAPSCDRQCLRCRRQQILVDNEKWIWYKEYLRGRF